ncbi:GAF and ANTAR domain-containing protein [Amycolatopsis sp. H20-H5]|uniref:GAF and ANTAR domain-containing protein n=1 Tax=Amycolatopsis sp. H20-H5 TaxID=3046309 RepID=UPI002DBF0B70|nr:GAF and ANTAR domain-containing protein [Amycolatopsis sp. H20-H5]MEC3977107.1 GAF and ANTAR domain-containing protein [Amycolatopsis sp. H20-H5]
MSTQEAHEEGWEADRAAFAAGGHGSSNGPLAWHFAQLTRTLLDASSVAGMLNRVVAAAELIVPGADLVSVTLRGPDGTFYTPAETAPEASEIDQLQYAALEGPCLDAARMSGPGHARCDNLATTATWPTFGPAAAAHGYGSLLATTLLPDSRPPQLSGALNLYSRREQGFGDQDQDLALLLSTLASLALASTQAVTTAALRQVQLRQAIDTRDVIGQAKGILMNRRKITADEAFDVLRRTSQDLNVKLADLAKTLTIRHAELDRTPSKPSG